MKSIRKLLHISLTAILGLILASSVASADSAYGTWTLIGQPSSTETFWGQNSVVSNSVHAIAITNQYSYRKIGATWQLYGVPAGTMGVRTRLKKDGYVVGEYSSWNLNTDSSYNVSKSISKDGVAGSIYTTVGQGFAYNAYDGTWFVEDIYESRAVSFPPSREAMIDEDSSEMPACGFLSNGESFGYLGMVGAKGGIPDWIGAYATNGERGYVKAEDHQVPMPKDPADAVANFGTLRVKSIPVYESPCGETVVGYYDMYYGGTQDVLDLSNGRLVCNE